MCVLSVTIDRLTCSIAQSLSFSTPSCAPPHILPLSLSLCLSLSLSLSLSFPPSLPQTMNTINNMLLTGCGTSRHAAELGAKIMRDLECFDTVSVMDAAEVRAVQCRTVQRVDDSTYSQCEINM